jgi:hypothetical protein
MLKNAMATATTWAIALATTLWVTKWAMVRATKAIVTNTIAAILVALTFAVAAAVFNAAADTTIVQCHCPQRTKDVRSQRLVAHHRSADKTLTRK